jgi:hypothetical protein
VAGLRAIEESAEAYPRIAADRSRTHHPPFEEIGADQACGLRGGNKPLEWGRAVEG